MQRLIADLLKYSRAGTRAVPREPVDTGRALDQALADLEPLIEETGTEVTRGELPTVQGDESQLAQVFLNLVGNAIKFRAPGRPPRIRIDGRRGEREWVLSVRDNGIGIPTDQQDCIFLLFQRLHSQSDYPGTGIGLAVCRRIVERHGGRIWVDSEPGVGSTFCFTLPDRQAGGRENGASS